MITDDDGRRPAIGDDDGGQLFPICGRDPEDCRDTLAVAAVLLDRPELAVGPVPEEAFWICGERAAGLDTERPAGWPSGALWNCGYYVSRTPTGDHLLFDAGPHGFLNGGHAHADALSVVLTVQGRPLLDRPGHGHLHDGSRGQRQVPRDGDAQHPDARSPAAMRALRAISVAVAGVGACARLVVRSRLRLRRRRPRGVSAPSPHAGRARRPRHWLVDSRSRHG